MAGPDLSKYRQYEMDEQWHLARLKVWGLEQLVSAFFDDPRYKTLYRLFDCQQRVLEAAKETADVYWRLYRRAVRYLQNPPSKLSRRRKTGVEEMLAGLVEAMATRAVDLDKPEVRQSVLRRLEQIQSDPGAPSGLQHCAEESFAKLVARWAKDDEQVLDAAIAKLRPDMQEKWWWVRSDLLSAVISSDRRDDEVITVILEGLENVGSSWQPELVQKLLERVGTNDRRVLSWLVKQLRNDFLAGVQLLLSSAVRQELGDDAVFALLVESAENAIRWVGPNTQWPGTRYQLEQRLKGFRETVLVQPEGKARWIRFVISVADHGDQDATSWALGALVELVPGMVQANEDINEIVETVLRHAERERDNASRGSPFHYAVRLARMLEHKPDMTKTTIERLVGYKVAILGPSQVAQVPSTTRPDFAMIRDSFNSLSQQYGLVYKPEDLERYHNALWANVGTGSHRHFVILAGPSGTGKTKMAQIYAAAVLGYSDLEALNDSNQFRLVSVRPEWTDARDIMGYYNPLAKEGEGEYIATPVLELILEASNQKHAPFFLVLDEMNIAHVEYYFSDILSAMESGAPIKLHSKTIEIKNERSNQVLRAENGEVTIPPNLFITGTINVDETTHEISPKVLDRAYVLKLSCDWGLFYKKSNLKDLSNTIFDRLFGEDGLIRQTAQVMEKAGLAFGYRTAEDIFRYLLNGKGDSSEIDWLFESKILPKIKGSDTEKLKEVLEKLKELANKRDLKNTASHLAEMLEELKQKGFVKFVPM